MISDAPWLSKLNLQKPRSFCLCWLHDSLWEKTSHQVKSQSIQRPPSSQGRPNEPCGETTRGEIPNHFQLCQPCQPQHKIPEWRSLQRTPDRAAIRQQPHEKIPGRTAQWNPANPDCKRYSQITILKPSSFMEVSYIEINHRNTHSFQETCDGIQNINKWIPPELMSVKAICSSIGPSFYNIDIDFYIIKRQILF